MPRKGGRTTDSVGKWEPFKGQIKNSWLSLSLPLLHDISQAQTCIPGSLLFKLKRKGREDQTCVVLACWDVQNWSFWEDKAGTACTKLNMSWTV